jgi:hypothetical protein
MYRPFLFSIPPLIGGRGSRVEKLWVLLFLPSLSIQGLKTLRKFCSQQNSMASGATSVGGTNS